MDKEFVNELSEGVSISDDSYVKTSEERSNVLMLDDLCTKASEVQSLEYKLKLKKQELDKMRAAYLLKMKNENVTKQENELVTVLIKDAYETRSVDTELMKKDGIYDKYAKTKTVAESLVIKLHKIEG